MVFSAPRGQIGFVCTTGPAVPAPRPGPLPLANWVCFARLPCVPRPWGLVPSGPARKLALFYRYGESTITPFPPSTWLLRPPDGIGFVWRHGPRDGWQRRGLRPVRGAQGRLLAMVFSASRGQIGFVCTTGPAAPVPQAWFLAAGKLGLFRTSAPRPPGPVSGIGFVSHSSPPGGPAFHEAAPDWVCLASFDPGAGWSRAKLGLFVQVACRLLPTGCRLLALSTSLCDSIIPP
jgi:hypothetical protein